MQYLRNILSRTKNRARKGFALLSNVVVVAVGTLLMGTIGYVAIDYILGVNTTGWDSEVVAIWDMLPIMIVVVYIIIIVGVIVKTFR